MAFPKSSPWLKELFASLLEGLACEHRQMFGYPCAFVNGQMFCGTFGNAIIVRLDEAGRAELLAVEGAAVFDPMGGRPMKEYVQFPDGMLEDEEALRGWIRRGHAYALSLPPKAARSAGRAAPAKKPATKRRPSARGRGRAT